MAEAPKARVYYFPNKRGRPKAVREEHDLGTPELQAKRGRSETAEPLDVLLAREIITAEQHWCGIHLRWLYTLRYGAPHIGAMDITRASGMDVHNDDPEWRAAREEEYHQAVRSLIEKYYAPALSRLCIYNEPPKPHDHPLIIEGLEMLRKLWRR